MLSALRFPFLHTSKCVWSLLHRGVACDPHPHRRAPHDTSNTTHQVDTARARTLSSINTHTHTHNVPMCARTKPLHTGRLARWLRTPNDCSLTATCKRPNCSAHNPYRDRPPRVQKDTAQVSPELALDLAFMPMERALGSTPHRRTDLQHEWTRTDIWPFTHTQRSGIQQYRHRLQLHRRDEPKASPSRAPDEQRSPTLHQISQQTEPMPMPSPALSTAPLRHRALHCRSQRQPPSPPAPSQLSAKKRARRVRRDLVTTVGGGS